MNSFTQKLIISDFELLVDIMDVITTKNPMGMNAKRVNYDTRKTMYKNTLQLGSIGQKRNFKKRKTTNPFSNIKKGHKRIYNCRKYYKGKREKE